MSSERPSKKQKVAGLDWEAIKKVLGDEDLFGEMKKGDVTSFDIQFEIHAKTIQVITPAILQQKNLSQLSATNHDESWGDDWCHIEPLLSKLPNITCLDFSNSDISYNNDQQWKKLSPTIGRLLNLTSLNIRNNGIRYEGWKYLSNAFAHLSCLEHLDISENYIMLYENEDDDEDDDDKVYVGDSIKKMFATLSKLEKLKSLILENTTISDACIEALAPSLVEMKALEICDLHGNNIRDEGVKILVSCLPKMTALCTLDASNNDFSDESQMLLKEAWESAGKNLDQLSLIKNTSSDDDSDIDESDDDDSDDGD